MQSEVLLGFTFLSLFIGEALSFSSIFGMKNKGVKDPEHGLDSVQLANKYGYPIEEHTVKTADGYIVLMHRIPHGVSNNATDKGPLLLVPGIMGSSTDWLNMGPERSFGYILADAGYDVWILNPRGTVYSRGHATYDMKVDKDKYWNFSWHEIGFYDLPAAIDLILKTSGDKKLHYVGHSQGATAFFVLASEKPAYNKKIKLMSAMAPVVYMSELPTVFFRFLAKPIGLIGGFNKAIGMQEFSPNASLYPVFGSQDCEEEAWLPDICTNMLFLACGYDSQQLEPSKIPLIASTSPAGTSTKTLLHFAQMFKFKNQFLQYDYGEEENVKRYGSPSPPAYDLSKVHAPVALFHSSNDKLASGKGVEQLRKVLPRVVLNRRVPFSSFNHLDFVWSKHVVKYVYSSVVDKMQEYE